MDHAAHTPILSKDQASLLYRQLRTERNLQNPARSESPLTKEEIGALLYAKNDQERLTTAKKTFLATFIPMTIALGLEWVGAMSIPPMAKVGGLVLLGAELSYMAFTAIRNRLDQGQLEKICQEVASVERADVQSDLQDQRAAILEAALLGNKVKIEALLHNDPNLIHAKTNTGKTLLHIAAELGDHTICNLLLTKGHDTNPVDSNGVTPYNATTSRDVRTTRIRQLLVSAHKEALCKKFFPAGSQIVEVKNVRSFNQFVASQKDSSNQITFGMTTYNPYDADDKLARNPKLLTVFREDILMTPYYGELLVIHEYAQVAKITEFHRNAVERKIPVDQVIQNHNANINLLETNAYFAFVSKGIELFPFLRDYPAKTDSPAITHVKKMFLRFGVAALADYYLRCRPEQTQIIRKLPHFQKTLDFAQSKLLQANAKKNKLIFAEMTSEFQTKRVNA